MIPASFLLSTGNFAEVPRDERPHVAMVGRSNVGKSSLINHLTGQKSLAHVSGEPGRTQTINLYEIDKRFFLVDLPGYGYAKSGREKRAIFSEMIHDYLLETNQLRLVLLVIDARIPLSELDVNTLDWLQRNQKPFVLVLNKMDKLSDAETRKVNQEFESKYPAVKRLEHSVNSGKNRNEILQVIESAVKEV